ncbi:thiamine biosynthesis protein ThiS [Actinoalloteichus sp. AHMU CJ021]|nr:thiamine biosynthesis protein ThiS [Actinoalloteichus sp. AHMU CJ021]
MMRVLINGRAHELAESCTVAGAVAAAGVPARGTAVALDGQLVPRAEWTRTELTPGARLEVLTAVQGG